MREEFEGGHIECESPNVIDGLKMVGMIKSALPDDWPKIGGGEALTAEMIRNMESLVGDVVIDGEKKEFSDLLTCRKAREALIKIADDLIGELFLDEKKSD